MQIDCSEVEKNAWLSISVSVAPDSNVTASSDLQPPKQSLPRTLTDDGIQIDFNDEQSENARSSIRDSFDRDSNAKFSSRKHRKKQDSQRISTDEGKAIDVSD
jgi:hypothetical protein